MEFNLNEKIFYKEKKKKIPPLPYFKEFISAQKNKIKSKLYSLHTNFIN